MGALGLQGIVGGTGNDGIRIQLEQNPTSNVNPQEYFQVFQSPTDGPSIRLIKGIDADVGITF